MSVLNKVNVISSVGYDHKICHKLDYISQESIAGVFSTYSHSWLTSGPDLFVISNSDGVLQSYWTFGENCQDDLEITCAVELPIEGCTIPLLILGLSSENTNFICFFNPNTRKVLRVIDILYPVRTLCIVEDGTNEVNPLNDALSPTEGLIAIGCADGTILLIDLCRSILLKAINGDFEYYTSEENPSNALYIEVDSIKLSGFRQHIIDSRKKKDTIAVVLTEPTDEGTTTLLYSVEPAVLFVGTSSGSFHMWNMSSLSCLFKSPGTKRAVISLSLLEPCDDPRHNLFLWVCYEEYAQVAMYCITFSSKYFVHGYGVYYQHFEAAGLVYRLTLGMEVDVIAKRPICSQAVAKLVPKNLVRCISLPEAEGTQMRLFITAYEIVDKGQISNRAVIFDLNQWYRDQMPDEGISSCLDSIDLDCKSLWHLQLDPRTLSLYQCVRPLEQHFHPSAFDFQVWCIEEEGIRGLEKLGLQSQWLRNMTLMGAKAIVEPTRVFLGALAADLLPSFVDTPDPEANNQQEERSYVLTVCLENRAISVIEDCAHEWQTGCHSVKGCTIQYLLEWLWALHKTYKSNGNKICIPLFDQSGIEFDISEKRSLQHCKSLLNTVQSVYTNIVNKYNKIIVTGVEEKLAAMSLVRLYFDVCVKLISVNLLPEPNDQGRPNGSITYPYNSIYTSVNNKRKEGPFLGDSLIGKTGAEKQWEEEGGDGCYPPPSIQSVLRFIIHPSPSLANKMSLLLYLFMDIVDHYTPVRGQAEKEKIKNFQHLMRISDVQFKIVAGCWYMDHLIFEEGVDFLLDPRVLSVDLSEDQHRDVLHLLASNGQEKLALQYLRLKSPSLHLGEDLRMELHLLLSNNLVNEAFLLQRKHPEMREPLLIEFFHGCIERKQLGQVFGLNLDLKEESVLMKYLRSSGLREKGDLQVLLLLSKAKYTEAIHLNDRLNTTINGPKSRIETDTRDMIVRGITGSLNSISRHMAHEMKTYRPPPSGTHPKPLSTLIKVRDEPDGPLCQTDSNALLSAAAKSTRHLSDFVNSFESGRRRKRDEEEDLYNDEDAPSRKRPKLWEMTSDSNHLPSVCKNWSTSMYKPSTPQDNNVMDLVGTPLVKKLGKRFSPQSRLSSILKAKTPEKSLITEELGETPKKTIRFTLPENEIPVTARKPLHESDITTQINSRENKESVQVTIPATENKSVSHNMSKLATGRKPLHWDENSNNETFQDTPPLSETIKDRLRSSTKKKLLKTVVDWNEVAQASKPRLLFTQGVSKTTSVSKLTKTVSYKTIPTSSTPLSQALLDITVTSAEKKYLDSPSREGEGSPVTEALFNTTVFPKILFPSDKYKTGFEENVGVSTFVEKHKQFQNTCYGESKNNKEMASRDNTKLGFDLTNVKNEDPISQQLKFIDDLKTGFQKEEQKFIEVYDRLQEEQVSRPTSASPTETSINIVNQEILSKDGPEVEKKDPLLNEGNSNDKNLIDSDQHTLNQITIKDECVELFQEGNTCKEVQKAESLQHKESESKTSSLTSSNDLKRLQDKVLHKNELSGQDLPIIDVIPKIVYSQEVDQNLSTCQEKVSQLSNEEKDETPLDEVIQKVEETPFPHPEINIVEDYESKRFLHKNENKDISSDREESNSEDIEPDQGALVSDDSVVSSCVFSLSSSSSEGAPYNNTFSLKHGKKIIEVEEEEIEELSEESGEEAERIIEEEVSEGEEGDENDSDNEGSIPCLSSVSSEQGEVENSSETNSDDEYSSSSERIKESTGQTKKNIEQNQVLICLDDSEEGIIKEKSSESSQGFPEESSDSKRTVDEEEDQYNEDVSDTEVFGLKLDKNVIEIEEDSEDVWIGLDTTKVNKTEVMKEFDEKNENLIVVSKEIPSSIVTDSQSASHQAAVKEEAIMLSQSTEIISKTTCSSPEIENTQAVQNIKASKLEDNNVCDNDLFIRQSPRENLRNESELLVEISDKIHEEQSKPQNDQRAEAISFDVPIIEAVATVLEEEITSQITKSDGYFPSIEAASSLSSDKLIVGNPPSNCETIGHEDFQSVEQSFNNIQQVTGNIAVENSCDDVNDFKGRKVEKSCIEKEQDLNELETNSNLLDDKSDNAIVAMHSRATLTISEDELVKEVTLNNVGIMQITDQENRKPSYSSVENADELGSFPSQLTIAGTKYIQKEVEETSKIALNKVLDEKKEERRQSSEKVTSDIDTCISEESPLVYGPTAVLEKSEPTENEEKHIMFKDDEMVVKHEEEKMVLCYKNIKENELDCETPNACLVKENIFQAFDNCEKSIPGKDNEISSKLPPTTLVTGAVENNDINIHKETGEHIFSAKVISQDVKLKDSEVEDGKDTSFHKSAPITMRISQQISVFKSYNKLTEPGVFINPALEVCSIKTKVVSDVGVEMRDDTIDQKQISEHPVGEENKEKILPHESVSEVSQLKSDEIQSAQLMHDRIILSPESSENILKEDKLKHTKKDLNEKNCVSVIKETKSSEKMIIMPRNECDVSIISYYKDTKSVTEETDSVEITTMSQLVAERYPGEFKDRITSEQVETDHYKKSHPQTPSYHLSSEDIICSEKENSRFEHIEHEAIDSLRKDGESIGTGNNSNSSIVDSVHKTSQITSPEPEKSEVDPGDNVCNKSSCESLIKISYDSQLDKASKEVIHISLPENSEKENKTYSSQEVIVANKIKDELISKVTDTEVRIDNDSHKVIGEASTLLLENHENITLEIIGSKQETVDMGEISVSHIQAIPPIVVPGVKISYLNSERIISANNDVDMFSKGNDKSSKVNENEEMVSDISHPISQLPKFDVHEPDIVDVHVLDNNSVNVVGNNVKTSDIKSRSNERNVSLLVDQSVCSDLDPLDSQLNNAKMEASFSDNILISQGGSSHSFSENIKGETKVNTSFDVPQNLSIEKSFFFGKEDIDTYIRAAKTTFQVGSHVNFPDEDEPVDPMEVAMIESEEKILEEDINLNLHLSPEKIEKPKKVDQGVVTQNSYLQRRARKMRNQENPVNQLPNDDSKEDGTIDCQSIDLSSKQLSTKKELKCISTQTSDSIVDKNELYEVEEGLKPDTKSRVPKESLGLLPIDLKVKEKRKIRQSSEPPELYKVDMKTNVTQDKQVLSKDSRTRSIEEIDIKSILKNRDSVEHRISGLKKFDNTTRKNVMEKDRWSKSRVTATVDSQTEHPSPIRRSRRLSEQNIDTSGLLEVIDHKKSEIPDLKDNSDLKVQSSKNLLRYPRRSRCYSEEPDVLKLSGHKEKRTESDNVRDVCETSVDDLCNHRRARRHSEEPEDRLETRKGRKNSNVSDKLLTRASKCHSEDNIAQKKCSKVLLEEKDFLGDNFETKEIVRSSDTAVNTEGKASSRRSEDHSIPKTNNAESQRDSNSSEALKESRTCKGGHITHERRRVRRHSEEPEMQAIDKKKRRERRPSSHTYETVTELNHRLEEDFPARRKSRRYSQDSEIRGILKKRNEEEIKIPCNSENSQIDTKPFEDIDVRGILKKNSRKESVGSRGFENDILQIEEDFTKRNRRSRRHSEEPEIKGILKKKSRVGRRNSCSETSDAVNLIEGGQQLRRHSEESQLQGILKKRSTISRRNSDVSDTIEDLKLHLDEDFLEQEQRISLKRHFGEHKLQDSGTSEELKLQKKESLSVEDGNLSVVREGTVEKKMRKSESGKNKLPASETSRNLKACLEEDFPEKKEKLSHSSSSQLLHVSKTGRKRRYSSDTVDKTGICESLHEESRKSPRQSDGSDIKEVFSKTNRDENNSNIENETTEVKDIKEIKHSRKSLLINKYKEEIELSSNQETKCSGSSMELIFRNEEECSFDNSENPDQIQEPTDAANVTTKLLNLEKSDAHKTAISANPLSMEEGCHSVIPQAVVNKSSSIKTDIDELSTEAEIQVTRKSQRITPEKKDVSKVIEERKRKIESQDLFKPKRLEYSDDESPGKKKTRSLIDFPIRRNSRLPRPALEDIREEEEEPRKKKNSMDDIHLEKMKKKAAISKKSIVLEESDVESDVSTPELWKKKSTTDKRLTRTQQKLFLMNQQLTHVSDVAGSSATSSPSRRSNRKKADMVDSPSKTPTRSSLRLQKKKPPSETD